MSRHLWRVIPADRSSIWVDWIFHYRLRDRSVWTVSDRTGSWGWQKLVRLRDGLRPFVCYTIGEGTSFSLWHDPWHTLGPLILQFPLGPQHTSIPDSALLCMVIMEGDWNWPPITNMESIGITHSLPPIHEGNDRIQWTGPRGSFSLVAAYDVFCPPGPKVGWSSLLLGTFKIPRSVLFYGWLFLDDCPPWINPGCNTWALLVRYARMLFPKLMSTCSLHAPLRLIVCTRYEARFPFTGLTLLGQWSFSGPRLDGGESTSRFIIYGKNGIDVSSNTLRDCLLILLGLLFLRIGI
ncbi:UNVERIFIED_CONTAM: hypothetical protein Slati_2213600 [Sesamum latifolium]|uniref:Reverse transcriptase zinc-binding domain-containing protein n=1 Tax=Sesamum latifolium TaxID=2727402 RepID=A0AAW2WSZ0_9LAMI